jgi:signal peptidase I
VQEQVNKPITKQTSSPARRFWREWVKPILVLLVALFAVRSSLADWNDVPTGSMKPTILEGDRIFVNKLAYDLKVPFLGWRLARWSDPGRGDVVVLASPADGTRLVKRVVGLPGDVLELIDNRLWVNGQPASYGTLDPAMVRQIKEVERASHRFAEERVGDQGHPVMFLPVREGPHTFGPVTVPDGHYFVMGDNRDNSLDSRSFGFVPRDTIQGRATAVVLSFDPEGTLRPRWHRFFHRMD